MAVAKIGGNQPDTGGPQVLQNLRGWVPWVPLGGCAYVGIVIQLHLGLVLFIANFRLVAIVVWL